MLPNDLPPPIASPHGDGFTPSAQPKLSQSRELFKARQLSVCAISLSFLLPLIVIALRDWVGRVAGESFPIILWSLFGALYLFQIYAAWKLINSMKAPYMWLSFLPTLIPCFGLFVLMMLNAVATDQLRRLGVEIGLMTKNYDIDDD